MILARLITALGALLLATVPPSAAEIATARGPVDVAPSPKTVAVFDIAALDTLDRLGLRPAGLPDRLYLPELAPLAAGATVVGTLFEPDLEALSGLAPDLIVVGGRSSPQLEAVAAVAPAIDMTIESDDLLGLAKARLAAYGTLFGRTEAAVSAAADLDTAVDRAREAAAGKGTALIIMTNGPKITAYGPGSRFGWIHRALDLPAAVDGIETAIHGEAVSFEFIRKANPDWLIVVDRGAAIGAGEASARATLDNDLVAATTAWTKRQVIVLPPGDVYIAAGGIGATIRVLDTLAAAFTGAP